MQRLPGAGRYQYPSKAGGLTSTGKKKRRGETPFRHIPDPYSLDKAPAPHHKGEELSHTITNFDFKFPVGRLFAALDNIQDKVITFPFANRSVCIDKIRVGSIPYP